jgi:hypothetical protein
MEGVPVTDPRSRRAEQLRDLVLLILTNNGPLRFSELVEQVRGRSISPVDDRAVDRALQALRRSGRVRYQRPTWEPVSVSTMEHRP